MTPNSNRIHCMYFANGTPRLPNRYSKRARFRNIHLTSAVVKNLAASSSSARKAAPSSDNIIVSAMGLIEGVVVGTGLSNLARDYQNQISLH
jgi:hypothetical protein